MSDVDTTIRTIAEEPVCRTTWESMFDQWKSGALRDQWAAEHRDLFDDDDLRIDQPDKYFAEWYAAIRLKQNFGWLSLISKFGYHGHKSHHRKQDVLRRCLTPDQHAYVVTNPQKLFGHSTGWPDLFVYAPDFARCLFCEVKGPNDSLRDRQISVFHALQDATGIEVAMFSFFWEQSKSLSGPTAKSFKRPQRKDAPQIFDENPDLKSLYNDLAAIENISVRTDGKGACIFKVYVSDRMDANQDFLRVYVRLDDSYAHWGRQDKHSEHCRQLWAPVVRNRSNGDGSKLKPGVSADTILRIVKQYARCVGA